MRGIRRLAAAFVLAVILATGGGALLAPATAEAQGFVYCSWLVAFLEQNGGYASFGQEGPLAGYWEVTIWIQGNGPYFMLCYGPA